MSVTQGTSAPYAPPATVLDVIQRFRDLGLQTPFTKEVMERAGVAESLSTRILQALQALDLIDTSGNPTSSFEGLRLSTQGEYKERLAEIVRSAYSEIFNFADPSSDDASKIRDAFRPYSPQGQQSRMVTLFLGLCEASGIITELPEGARPVTRKRRSVKRSVAKGGSSGVKRTPTPSFGKIGLPSALAGLLQSLPAEGQPWTQEQRDKFVSTFKAVLDFCYPIGQESVENEEEQEQG